MESHRNKDVADFRNDLNYKELVSEMLNVHVWSIEQLERDSGLPLGLPLSYHSVKEVSEMGVALASRRLSEHVLMHIYDQYRDMDGGLSRNALKSALLDAGAPILSYFNDDDDTFFNAYARIDDTDFQYGLGFRSFYRIAKDEADDLEMYLEHYNLSIMADSLRPHLKHHDKLQDFAKIEDGVIRVAADATAKSLIHRIMEPVLKLRNDSQLFKQCLQEPAPAGRSKFHLPKKMSYGVIEDFYAGFSDRVGMPNLDFFCEMRREHCERAGCNTQFTTDNYEITTTPRQEWLYVVGDENGLQIPCPALHHCRRIVPLEQLLQRPLARQANLSREEIIALVLYTGPMSQVYNIILRRFPDEKYKQYNRNLFTTTIFVLASAVTKLARYTRLSSRFSLYLGLDGLTDLPDHFFKADSNGASGFLNWGFMSTTLDRDVALGYSGVKHRRSKAMVMVIETAQVDNAADISEFSQYPCEKEFLWAPYTFLQRGSMPQGQGRIQVVDGSFVTFVPVKVNVNMKTETLEELKEKKKRLHLASARAMLEEVRYELGQWAASQDAAARLHSDWRSNQCGTFSAATLAASIVEQCAAVVQRHEAVSSESYVDDGSFRDMGNEILHTKAYAIEKKELWMNDTSQSICFLQAFSLRVCHRLWLSFLRMRIDGAAVGSCERHGLSNLLLKSRGLVNREIRDVMVQAGADGWAASDIAAAAAAGADAGAIDDLGCNGVCNAAKYGCAESMVALLAAGVDLISCDNDGRSPIWMAAKNGHTQCLMLLLSAGGDVNKCDNDGVSPICVAAENGHAPCLKLVLSASGDVNKCNNDGRSPIYNAAENGYTDCLTLLLSAGGDPRINFNGVSALDIARQKGHAECIRVLEAALT